MRNCKENFSKKKKKKFKEKGPLFAIYASLRFTKRRLLWENLIAVSGLHSLPWVIVGDFNEVLMGEDKFGGRSVNINRAFIFQECLDTCRMIDIGYSGAWFTWSNHHPLNHLIQERIDWVFINAEWNFLYLDASVQHFERGYSNHCPFYYAWTRIMMLNCLSLLDSNLCGYPILHSRVSSKKLGSARLVYLVQLPILLIR